MDCVYLGCEEVAAYSVFLLLSKSLSSICDLSRLNIRQKLKCTVSLFLLPLALLSLYRRI